MRDDAVEKGSRFQVKVGNGVLAWNNSFRIQSQYLYDTHGQNKYVYISLNRVPYGDFRSGSGLCNVRIQMKRNKGKILDIKIAHYCEQLCEAFMK